MQLLRHESRRSRDSGGGLTKIKKVIASLTVLILLTFSTLSVSAATVNVPAVKQSFSNWCWAACAEMEGKGVNPSSSVTQDTIVTLLFGSGSPNVGANAYTTATACSIGSSSTKTFYVATLGYSYSQIMASINAGYPLVGIMGNVNGTTNLHDIVIYGYTTVSSVNYVYIVDPSTGGCKQKTYTSIANGSWYGSGSYPYSGTIYTY